MSEAPADDDLVVAIRETLAATWDLDSVTLNTVRSSLEARFGCDLSGRKDVLKQALREYVESMHEKEREEQALAECKDGENANSGADDDDEEEEYDDDEPTGEGESRLKRKRGGGGDGGGKKGKKGGGGGRGFAAEVQLSAELSEFLGVTCCPRTEVTKRVWAYIKEHKLQNPEPKKGQEILCDERLQKVLKVKKIHMFKMTKILSEQMKSSKDLAPRALPKDVDEDDDEEADSDDEAEVVKVKAKKPKSAPAKRAPNKKKSEDDRRGKTGTGFMKPLQLSPALAALLGEDQMARPTVVKMLWEHIRGHQLQNPSDRREILCDQAMKKVFRVDKITMFSMNKLLVPHLTPVNGAAGSGNGKKKAAVKVEEEEEEDDEEEGDDE